MTRVLVTLLALATLLPASAAAASTQDHETYQHGLDAYLGCIAEAGPGVSRVVGDHVACAEELAADWTDGGQVRRLPLCVRNRALEYVSGENGDPVGSEMACVEQYLGTDLDRFLPKISLPPSL